MKAARACPVGEIGRRNGLKIRCPQGRVGSNPSPGTILGVCWDREGFDHCYMRRRFSSGSARTPTESCSNSKQRVAAPSYRGPARRETRTEKRAANEATSGCARCEEHRDRRIWKSAFHLLGRDSSCPRSETLMGRPMPVKEDRFKGHRFGWQNVAIVALVPVGIGAYCFGASIAGETPKGPILGSKSTLQGLALGAIARNTLYRLARTASRRNGAIFVALDHGR